MDRIKSERSLDMREGSRGEDRSNGHGLKLKTKEAKPSAEDADNSGSNGDW